MTGTQNKMNPPTLLLCLFITLLRVPFSLCCPPKELLHPCTCEKPDFEGSSYVTCAGLDNDQDLAAAASALRGRSSVYSVTIQNSAFIFIPSDAFKGAQFVELEIRDTTLMALTDTDVAFEGMEDYLEIFMMTDSTLMNEWDWSIFRNFNKLMRFDIVRGNMANIGDLEQYNISSLSDINLDSNQISHVDSKAFAAFTHLRFLNIANNAITMVERSMLPDPAEQLLTFDISYNRIEQLPPDMFTNMPLLNNIAIGGNRILVLNEKTFAPVWQQLELFNAMGNELRCDCRMSWILEQRLPENLRAICYQPPQLKGKSLSYLSSKDLWCY